MAEMMDKPLPATPKSMSDIAQRLSSHDFEIHALGTRMGSVEGKVDRLGTSMSMGFDEIKGLLSEQKEKQGPGLKEVLLLVSVSGALIGMAAAAITTLVTSFVTPEITTLKDTTVVLSKDHDARIAAEREELARLRENRKTALEAQMDEINARIEKLQSKADWATRIEGKYK
jgi:hypothetical protein